MAGVSVRIEGGWAAIKALEGIKEDLTNSYGLWDTVGSALASRISERFQTGKGPGGEKWPPSIRALMENGQTLVKSGDLEKSISWIATDFGVAIGTNREYGAIHQFGGVIHQPARQQVMQFKTHKKTGKILPGFRKRGKSNLSMKADVPAHDVRIPARPFLGIDDGDEEAIKTAVGVWLQNRLATP